MLSCVRAHGDWSLSYTYKGALPDTRYMDIDSAASASDPYASLKTQFSVAKQLIAATAVIQGATDGGAAAIADAYHTTLVSPFCLAAVKSFFAAQ